MSGKAITPKKGRKSNTTSKKVKVVGTQDFIDATTGEIVQMQVSKYEERDFNFTKIWMRDFILSLEIIGNKKMDVAFWVIEHINSENMLVGTIRNMANELNVSTQTVQLTLNALIESGLLKRLQSGLYMINPNIVFKGGHQKRLNILHQYTEPQPKEKSEEQTIDDKIANYEKLLVSIQTELTALRNQKAAISVEVDPQLSFDKEGNIYQEARDAKNK